MVLYKKLKALLELINDIFIFVITERYSGFNINPLSRVTKKEGERFEF